MFVKHVKEIIGTERDASGEGWKSRRLILAQDGLKYSVHETTIDETVSLRFCYAGHCETVYCIDGVGSIQNLKTGEKWDIKPGTIYSVGIGDDHLVESQTVMKLLCIFDPPLKGQEEAD
jgi:L-ectoine synthase